MLSGNRVKSKKCIIQSTYTNAYYYSLNLYQYYIITYIYYISIYIYIYSYIL
uniref:Uncharacterized protein n=1 Tax=Phage sp. ctGns7 TaxID=2828003 RepID=A0A8S5S943_9VIRU|nr:MAG TPA: hypothetical protein [Phage sp. ctGns7]